MSWISVPGLETSDGENVEVFPQFMQTRKSLIVKRNQSRFKENVNLKIGINQIQPKPIFSLFQKLVVTSSLFSIFIFKPCLITFLVSFGSGFIVFNVLLDNPNLKKKNKILFLNHSSKLQNVFDVTEQLRLLNKDNSVYLIIDQVSPNLWNTIENEGDELSVCLRKFAEARIVIFPSRWQDRKQNSNKNTVSPENLSNKLWSVSHINAEWTLSASSSPQSLSPSNPDLSVQTSPIMTSPSDDGWITFVPLGTEGAPGK
jgi:hypothetical protein